MIRKIIKKIISIPAKIIHKLKKIFSKLSSFMERKFERVLIKTKHYRTVEVSISDILLKLTNHGELLRCDIIVRYLAIENYYGINTYGFELYRKMQEARKGIGYGEKAIDQFKRLIESYDKNGYQKDSGIFLDKNLGLIDGSHRIAMALYHHIPNITAFIVKTNHPVDYSIDWFIQHGFSSTEVNYIINKYKELLHNLDSRFACIIWSPAIDMKDEIINDLKIYGDVGEVKEYTYSLGEYENIVKAIYSIDDIEKWKIEKKISHMKKYVPRLLYVDLSFKDPEFRIKSSTNLPLSKMCERTKKSLRTKYQNRIDDYFFDIVMHIGDNIYQSDYMRRVLEPDISIVEIVNLLNKYDYSLVKTDVPYMPHDFPTHFPVGKDLDIICKKEDFSNIINEIINTTNKYHQYSIIIVNEKNGTRIRLQQSKTLYYQFDVSYNTQGLSTAFTEDAISARTNYNKLYYTLSPEYEFLYRLNALHKKNTKTHHREYLFSHMESFNEELAKKYCEFNYQQIIATISTEKQ